MPLSQNELKLVSQNCSDKMRKSIEREQFFQTPFKHLVIDVFFPYQMAQTCIDNFPIADTDSLNSPEGEERRSIILYYYTKEEREPNTNIVREPHSVLWKKRNILDKRGNKIRKAFNDEKA